MAIDLQNPDSLRKLQRAIEYNYEKAEPSRARRKRLIDIFRGQGKWPSLGLDQEGDQATPINLFQAFVRGHLLSVAHQLPRWGVKGRTQGARGFANTAKAFLTRYTEILDLGRVFRQVANDSAYGNAVIKTVNGPPPKGIKSPVVPRSYRISPNNLILDHSATEPEEGLFIADTYLISWQEAREYEHYDPEVRATLQPWRDQSGGDMLPDEYSDQDVLAEEMTRVIDVYLPSLGALVTWPASESGRKFSEITSGKPLAITRTLINPYSILQLLTSPESLEELSHLEALRELHLIANDGFSKAAKQMRQSKRNPTGKMGDDQDLDVLLQKGEGEGVMLDRDAELDVFALPGPDQSVVGLSQMAMGMFSQQAGNLDVALGNSAGADTARQTQALLGQIGSNQAFDRLAFEMFMADVGKKLLTLAYESETLELHTMAMVPGTRFSYPVSWLPPDKQPRTASIDDFLVDTVPYSASYRPPEARLQQLQQASQILLQWLAAKAQGLPVNIPAIIKSLEEAFDLLGDLQEWFDAEPPPTPGEKVQQQYMGTPGAHEGTRVQYDSNASGNSGGGLPAFAEASPGFQNS